MRASDLQGTARPRLRIADTLSAGEGGRAGVCFDQEMIEMDNEMENQMENKMENRMEHKLENKMDNEMGTGIICRVIWRMEDMSTQSSFGLPGRAHFTCSNTSDCFSV